MPAKILLESAILFWPANYEDPSYRRGPLQPTGRWVYRYCAFIHLSSCIDSLQDNNETVEGSCNGRHVDIVRVLLDNARVNPGDPGGIVFRRVRGGGNGDIVCLLLQGQHVVLEA